MTTHPNLMLGQFTQRAQQAIQQGSPAPLEQYVDSLDQDQIRELIPEIENVLFSLKAPQDNQKEKTNLSWLKILSEALLVGIIILLCVGINILLYNISPKWKDFIDKFLFKLTPIPSSVPTTVLTPTSTVTPTITPTLTPTVTQTPTLAPILPSVYRKNYNDLDIQPLLFNDELWLLEPSPVLTTTVQELIGNDKFPVYSSSDPLTLVWQMDVGLDSGYYALAVLDTEKQSAGEQEFKVYLDDNIATPYRSLSTVVYDEKGPQSDKWLPIGFYQVGYNQRLKVEAIVAQRTEQTPFAITPLLIQKVSGFNEQILTSSAPLDNDRPIVQWLDDVAEFVSMGDTPSRQYFFTTPSDRSWNGKFSSYRGDWLVPLKYAWTGVGKIKPGKYQLLVWLPPGSGGSVEAEYILWVNDKQITANEWGGKFNMANYPDGGWIDVGIYQVEETGAVEVVMQVNQTYNNGTHLPVFDLVVLAQIP